MEIHIQFDKNTKYHINVSHIYIYQRVTTKKHNVWHMYRRKKETPYNPYMSFFSEMRKKVRSTSCCPPQVQQNHASSKSVLFYCHPTPNNLVVTTRLWRDKRTRPFALQTAEFLKFPMMLGEFHPVVVRMDSSSLGSSSSSQGLQKCMCWTKKQLSADGGSSQIFHRFMNIQTTSKPKPLPAILWNQLMHVNITIWLT